MAFKVKNKPIKKIIDNRITLDARHTNKILDLEQKKELICNKKNDLTSLKQTLKLLNKNFKKNVDKIIDKKDKIIKLEESIEKLNKNNEIDYFLDTGHLL